MALRSANWRYRSAKADNSDRSETKSDFWIKMRLNMIMRLKSNISDQNETKNDFSDQNETKFLVENQ